MNEEPERSAQRLLARIVVPARDGLLRISILEIVASGLTIAFLVWMNQGMVHERIPLLVPSFAASIAVLYTQWGMTSAKTWNVVMGQFLGALAGFITCSFLHAPSALAAGVAVGLGLVFMRIGHALHPPGAATALIITLDPTDQGMRFLFLPVLVGALLIVAIAWGVHHFELRILRRIRPRLAEELPEARS